MALRVRWKGSCSNVVAELLREVPRDKLKSLYTNANIEMPHLLCWKMGPFSANETMRSYLMIVSNNCLLCAGAPLAGVATTAI